MSDVTSERGVERDSWAFWKYQNDKYDYEGHTHEHVAIQEAIPTLRAAVQEARDIAHDRRRLRDSAVRLRT